MITILTIEFINRWPGVTLYQYMIQLYLIIINNKNEYEEKEEGRKRRLQQTA